MSALTAFQFQSHAVRQGGTPEKPWFIARDVCEVLSLNNVSQALSSLDDDEKGIINADTLGGKQTLAIVYESGLYALIFKSRKPEAHAFRKWVTSEVLPAIRKTGGFLAANVDPIVDLVERNMQALAALRDVRLAQLATEAKAIEAHHLAEAAIATANSHYGYFSVLGYCKLRNRELTVAEAAAHGKRLTAVCGQAGIRIERISDPRFGRVNVYPESALRAYFDALDN